MTDDIKPFDIQAQAQADPDGNERFDQQGSIELDIRTESLLLIRFLRRIRLIVFSAVAVIIVLGYVLFGCLLCYSLDHPQGSVALTLSLGLSAVVPTVLLLSALYAVIRSEKTPIDAVPVKIVSDVLKNIQAPT